MHATAQDESITRLYHDHRLALLRLAIFLVDDLAVAEELVQDAFTALHRRWHRLEDTDAALGYLRISVINAARTALRRRGLARRQVRLADALTAPPADHDVLIAEEHREVLAALRTLPHRQREVLVLRYWSEFSEAAIATTLGIARGTVKSTASRALDALEAKLKERQ